MGANDSIYLCNTIKMVFINGFVNLEYFDSVALEQNVQTKRTIIIGFQFSFSSLNKIMNYLPLVLYMLSNHNVTVWAKYEHIIAKPDS